MAEGEKIRRRPTCAAGAIVIVSRVTGAVVLKGPSEDAGGKPWAGIITISTIVHLAQGRVPNISRCAYAVVCGRPGEIANGVENRTGVTANCAVING